MSPFPIEAILLSARAKRPDFDAATCDLSLAAVCPNIAKEPELVADLSGEGPSAAGLWRYSVAPAGYNPRRMPGNTPEGLRYFMYHLPGPLLDATAKLFDAAYPQLTPPYGPSGPTLAAAVDEGGKHLSVAAVTLAALRLHAESVSAWRSRTTHCCA